MHVFILLPAPSIRLSFPDPSPIRMCFCSSTSLPPAETDPDVSVVAAGNPEGDGSRHNTGAKHEEGMKHITPALREAASRANSVDEALHEFVSAKFCQRLGDAGLLDHPLVEEELATFELLDQR